VRTIGRHHVEFAHHRVAQVGSGRLLRTVQKFFAVDDLHDAALVGAVAEIDAVALRPGRDHPVQIGRNGAGRAGLLADQTEIANFNGLGRIAEIDHLGHAPRAPVFDAGDKVGNSGVALPPAFVGVLKIPARS